MNDHLTDMMPPEWVPLPIGDVTYKLSALRMSDYVKAATELKERGEQPADVLKQLWPILDEATRTEVAKQAYAEIRAGIGPSTAEVERWFGTPAGTLYRFWLMFHRHQPEITLEQVDGLLAKANSLVLDRALGGNPLAPAASGDDSIGGESVNVSANNTDGHQPK